MKGIITELNINVFKNILFVVLKCPITVRGLAMAGHLSTKVEANSNAKYSENIELLPKALLAPNRC